MLNHPKDTQYFKEYPAPIMENLQNGHFTNINSTITFFGPMLYFFARSIGAEQILEIGHAEGYTSHYLAHAVKDNATRFKMAGNRYYGIDIVQTDKVRQNLLNEHLPVTVLTLDSMKLTPETFKDVKFDIIFQDGCHDDEHVVYEMETMYDQLKGNGTGYWIFHDCYGPSEEGWHKIIKDPRYNWEFVRIFCPYGLGILRKMDGYDNSKRFWVQEKGFAG